MQSHEGKKNALSTVVCEVSSLIVSFPSPNLAMSLTFRPQVGRVFFFKALGNDLDDISAEITS